MTLNLIKIAFIFSACTTGFLGLLINFFEKYLPASLSKIFRYGKFAADIKDAVLDKCEVPKRWFKHYYAFAGPFSTIAIVMVFYRYFFGGKHADAVQLGLSFLLGKPIRSLVPDENVILAMTIFTIHCWKRFYESHFVSVYSDQYMNVSLYLLGFFHYFGSVISIVGESQNFLKGTEIDLNWSRLSMLDWACALIFLVSTYLQYRSNIILSNLRKDKKGVVVTKKHKVPHGGLFNYVTAPLQLTEIILYLCLSAILRSASTFHFVTLWVLINQMECAYLSHEWSLRKFENYPKSRKIIIPYVF
ncbi:polyprenol reductase [Nasonia vitripennis]|uniref:Polyprenal reductase n=1 Tax=Nasonia vitripennis TaxID=7425 RepID=A0A7M7LLU9_NASVI|nr:polyprenol reductase [Nasonia vitripennis]